MRRKLVFAGSIAGVVLVLMAASAEKKPALTTAYIDHLIRAEWKKESIVPAPPADDARYFRRIYLDIAGVIPPAEEVKAFLADKSPDKRANAVDQLLKSPQYVENWTNYWDEVLMGHTRVAGNIVDRVAWRKWLKDQFAKNTPYDRFVYDLISATGQNSVGGSYARMAGLMTKEDQDAEAASGEAGKINGAVNWFLKYQQAPADLSGAVSKTFLGVQIQCAQCHDHKTEKWKQEDFRKFTACFSRTRPVPIDRTQVQGVRRLELRDIELPLFRRPAGVPRGMNEYANATPTALDGASFDNSPNRRKALAEWIISKENPWFSQAIVNRMWGHFLGRGFVEPINDFRDSNPANMPHLLKLLAEDFEANNFDLRHLIKQITSTQVYQLSSAPAKKDDSDNTLWARYRLKPMAPPQLLESLVQATDMTSVLQRVAGGNLEQLKQRALLGFTFLFDVDEEQEQKEFEGTIPQALLLLNGGLTNSGASPIPGAALSEVLEMSGDDAQKIEALYLRTLSRKPTTAELKKWSEFIYAPRKVVSTEPTADQRPLTPRERRQLMQQLQRPEARRGAAQDPFARLGGRVTTSDPRHQAYEDLFWALLNSSEFIFNH